MLYPVRIRPCNACKTAFTRDEHTVETAAGAVDNLDVAIGTDDSLAFLVGGGYIADAGEMPGLAKGGNMPDADTVYVDGVLQTMGHGKADGFTRVGF